MFESMIVSLGIYLLKLIIAVSLSVFTVYFSLQMFNKTTKKIDEIEEIKKGNVAVSIMLIAIVLSIASIIQGGIENITNLINPRLAFDLLVVAIIFSLVQLLFSLIVALIVIKLALYVMSRIFKGFDYEVQLKKGNVAVALLMGGILLAISFVIKAGAATLSLF
jgi:uncharacterized membrane protein YjfL (UPF0719 family)